MVINKFPTYYLLIFAVCLIAIGCTKSEVQSTAEHSETAEVPSLADTYEGMFKIGVALNRWQIEGRVEQATPLISRHFNAITPENLLKWSRLHPEPGEYNFDPADAYVEFGEEHNMFIVGHTLVWHSQVPSWVFEDENGEQVGREELLNRMKEHISTVVGRYKGRVNGWDVVNEAATGSDGLRKSKWYNIVGEDFIDKAFEYTHEVDPDAELYYNDYNLWAPDKRATVVKMVKRLQENNVPIDGIGMQAHMGLDHPSLEQIEASIKAYADLGVKVMITELDVSVLPSRRDANISYNPDEGARGGGDVPEALNPYTEGLPDSVQQQLKERYIALFKLFKKHQDKIERVTFWGLNDGQSWLNNFPIPGRTNYPLLFDRDFKPKPAFYGLIDVAENE